MSQYRLVYQKAEAEIYIKLNHLAYLTDFTHI